jgi:Zn ribbon nucleic-acid-binding protein
MAEAMIGKAGEEFSPGTVLTPEGMSDVASRDARLRYDEERQELWLTLTDEEAADFEHATRRPVRFSASFTVKLDKEGEEIRDRLFREQPSSCPACGFTDPTRMFARNADNLLACCSCGHVLQEGDFWPDEISTGSDGAK